MTIEESKKLILQTIKNVMEEKISADNVEVMVVRADTRKVSAMQPDEVNRLIETLA
jgi:20S proteasome alpha/beta subunit|tara:strand:- start:8 stop:175 length:168 start_codon:yes stop_codon:yes gene_type:complete